MSEGFATDKELALAWLGVDADQFRGFGATDVDAMRDAVESGRVTWDMSDGPTWVEVTWDAYRAAILTFTRTPFGFLVTDNN